MVAQSFGNRAQYATAVAPSQRPVGYLLALGIFIAPYIFGWFVLRAGYSAMARIVTFGWCFIILTAAFSAHTGSDPTPVADHVEQSAAMAISSDEQLASAKNAAVAAQTITAAPDGDPAVVAQTVIRASFDESECPLVLDARRLGDGTIQALCSNDVAFRVLTMGRIPLAMNCTAAAKYGVQGC